VLICFHNKKWLFLRILDVFDFSQQQFWWILVLIIISATSGILISSFLWIRRKKKVLNNLERLIYIEKNEAFEESKNSKAKDIEDAFKELFKSRKIEMQRLQQLENYRRDYIGNVAHELKTPLFSIQGYIETILDDPKIDKETLELFLKKAYKNADRLGQIVNDLDTITKYESGFLQIETERFDILALVNEVIEELEIQAKERNIQINCLSKSEPYWIEADKSRIRQVLVNLGYNSIKYGNQGGTTNIKLSSTGLKVIVEFADNGIGIPSQHLGRVFERFYRVDKHRNRETGGSGLGLSICKHIIEAHDETIRVMSTEGAGSVFTFTLPCA
jgi:two-component system phosphate regulon sensor histidine kinase PhoR